MPEPSRRLVQAMRWNQCPKSKSYSTQSGFLTISYLISQALSQDNGGLRTTGNELLGAQVPLGAWYIEYQGWDPCSFFTNDPGHIIAFLCPSFSYSKMGILILSQRLWWEWNDMTHKRVSMLHVQSRFCNFNSMCMREKNFLKKGKEKKCFLN